MKKIKLLHSNLDQIVDSLEKFNSTELESICGGGSGTYEDPYTWTEYKNLGVSFTKGWVDVSSLRGIECVSYRNTPYSAGLEEELQASFYGFSGFSGFSGSSSSFGGYGSPDYGNTGNTDSSNGSSSSGLSRTGDDCHCNDAPIGSPENPYTVSEWMNLMSDNNWRGGYVKGQGFVAPSANAYGNRFGGSTNVQNITREDLENSLRQGAWDPVIEAAAAYLEKKVFGTGAIGLAALPASVVSSRWSDIRVNILQDIRKYGNQVNKIDLVVTTYRSNSPGHRGEEGLLITARDSITGQKYSQYEMLTITTKKLY